MVVTHISSDNLINCDNVLDQIASLSFKVVESLKEKCLTIAIAESCTGGLVSKSITDIPGSSSVFHCGIVSYSCDVKQKVLGVEKKLLDESGPINVDTALQMAKGVRELANADIGISTTGVAGPGPDGNHSEGEIYLSLVTKKDSFVIKLETGLVDSRKQNRQLACANILSLANKYLENELKEG